MVEFGRWRTQEIASRGDRFCWRRLYLSIARMSLICDVGEELLVEERMSLNWTSPQRVDLDLIWNFFTDIFVALLSLLLCDV